MSDNRDRQQLYKLQAEGLFCVHCDGEKVSEVQTEVYTCLYQLSLTTHVTQAEAVL